MKQPGRPGGTWTGAEMMMSALTGEGRERSAEEMPVWRMDGQQRRAERGGEGRGEGRGE